MERWPRTNRAETFGAHEDQALPNATIREERGAPTRSRRPGRRAPHGARPPILLPLIVALAAIVVTASGLMTYSDQLGFDGGALNAGGPHTSTASATPTAAPTRTPIPRLDALYNQQMGCSFGAPPPVPNVILSTQNIYNPAPTTKEVALTFDDGPTPYSTPPILDVLERTHTPATFFVEGSYVHTWPYLIQREWRDGFAFGVHTWDHPMMTRLTPAQRQFQFRSTIDALHSVLGANACIWFWRPPYGDFNGAVLQQAATFGLTTVTWDVDPLDWSRPGTDLIVSRVLAEVHPGSIILMHDGPALREQTAAAIPAILAGLKARGLTPVTLPRLLADNNFPGLHILGVPLRLQ